MAAPSIRVEGKEEGQDWEEGWIMETVTAAVVLGGIDGLQAVSTAGPEGRPPVSSPSSPHPRA